MKQTYKIAASLDKGYLDVEADASLILQRDLNVQVSLVQRGRYLKIGRAHV